MRSFAATITISALISGSAVAQDTTPASSGVAAGWSNAAVNPPGNSTSTVNASGTVSIVSPAALEKGANSFTENQVMKRIEGAGFTAVAGLHKDDLGVWRGQAMRDGKPVTLGFDYKGNVAAQ